MCATCGCSDGAGALVALHDHVHEPGHDHDHAHAHDGHTHALTTHDARTIVFAERAILALNLVSSPGSGKTTLLERTIRDLGGTLPMAVIEGDQATENDSRRVRAAGARAVQVNTGTGCHLEADMIRRALELLAPAQRSVVMIENVGNLVCPALFDLGERAKVAILSVTEGDDKPAKYPHMFAAADLLVINKTDLLPYVDFDIDRCIGHARAVRPNLDAIAVSATSGDNLDAWYAWILKARRAR
jgi:hydrogenase nickel incorporation protein HypB